MDNNRVRYFSEIGSTALQSLAEPPPNVTATLRLDLILVVLVLQHQDAMDSPDMSRMNGAASPDGNSIMVVTQRCNCDKERAINLLSRSNNDPEQAIKRHNLVEKYRGKLSARPSQATTPTTPRSEASLSPGLNGDHRPHDRLRLNPKTVMRKPLAQSLGSSGYEHGSDVQSSDPHIDAHSPFLSPSQNGYFEAAAGGLSGRFAGLNVDERIPENDSGPESDIAKGESPNFNPRNVDEGEPKWDFVLPVIPLPIANLGPGSFENHDTFDLRKLVGVMQNGAGLQTIQNYLERFGRARVKEHINENIDGFPAMFYVVETN
ncbi:hypothetical protein MMC22_006211 [Lobaria immixta]|nr:hypothetical protein [Lobaria immixta]